MSVNDKIDASDLDAIRKLARQWEHEVQKDIDRLAELLDKLDRGETIPKDERRRARAALKRLQR